MACLSSSTFEDEAAHEAKAPDDDAGMKGILFFVLHLPLSSPGVISTSADPGLPDGGCDAPRPRLPAQLAGAAAVALCDGVSGQSSVFLANYRHGGAPVHGGTDAGDGKFKAAKATKARVSEAARHAKDTVRSASDSESDIARRAEVRAEDAAESAADRAAEAEEEVKARAGEVGKILTDYARRAREVESDAAGFLLGAPRDAARAATAVKLLLAFATAYCACVWVTFVSTHVLAAAALMGSSHALPPNVSHPWDPASQRGRHAIGLEHTSCRPSTFSAWGPSQEITL